VGDWGRKKHIQIARVFERLGLKNNLEKHFHKKTHSHNISTYTVCIQENKTETKEILCPGFIFLDTYCIVIYTLPIAWVLTLNFFVNVTPYTYIEIK